MNQFPIKAILLPLLVLPLLLACVLGVAMFGAISKVSGLSLDELSTLVKVLIFFSIIYRLAYWQAVFHWHVRSVRYFALGIATGAWLLLCLAMLVFFRFGFPETLFWMCFYAWLGLWEGRKFAHAWRAALARKLYCHKCGAEYELDNEWTCGCGETSRRKHPAEKCQKCRERIGFIDCLQCGTKIGTHINQKFPKGYPSLLTQLKDLFGGKGGTSRPEPAPARVAQPQPKAPDKLARTTPEPNQTPANGPQQQLDSDTSSDLDDLRVVVADVADDLDVFERLGKAFLAWQRTKAEQESQALNGLVAEMQRDKVAYTVQELQKELVQQAKTCPLRTLGKVLYVHYAVKKLETANEILRRLAPHAMRELESR